jgi:multiple sugar transport system permease protein
LALTVLAIMAAFFVVPIVWAIVETFSGSAAPGALNVGFNATPAATGSTGEWLLNSMFYSTSGAAIALILGITAGYGLASYDFPGRRLLLVVTVIVMLIPPNALALPLFLEANAAHLLASPLAVILPYGLFPFGVYLAYLFFNTPRFRVLFQAARADGCGEWAVFRRIAVPLSLPVAALIVFLNFLASWTNFFLPWVMYWSFGQTGRYPVSLGIALQLDTSQTSGFYTGQLQLHTTSSPSHIALLLVVTCAPVLAVFIGAQRWIGAGQARDWIR